MNKREILDSLIHKLERDASVIESSARAAHEAATHEESRAEDSHDTRGLEASYLAGAQAQRLTELQAQVSVCRQLSLREFGPKDAVAPGALVELRLGGRTSHCFVVPRGGGTVLDHQGVSVQVIAPQSPLGNALMGRAWGESFEVETHGAVREYEVVRLW